ncbi:MAG TPA: MFS transporter [Deinococcales bacterium]|nr:MFS transporter [Deinococcales bacterium]
MQTPADAPGGVFDPPLRNLTTGLMLSILLVAFQSMAIATVMPQAARELNGLSLYGWAFSAFFLGYMVSTVVLGSLADRDGPRRPLTIALVLLTAGLVLAATAASMPVFVLGRALQGLGGGAIGSIAYLAVNRAYPPDRRARVLALFSSAWILPGLLGPVIASALAAQFSWRAVFYSVLPFLAAVAVLTLPALNLVPAGGTPFDRRRALDAAVAAVGAVITLAGLQQASAAAGAALLVAGLGLLVPALARLLPQGTFRLAGPLQGGMVVRFLLTFAFLGADSMVPLALTELRGFSTAASGVVLTVSAVFWSLGSALQARLDERLQGRGRVGRVRFGFAMVAASIGLLLAVVRLPALPPVAAGLAWAAGGLGMGFAFPAHTLVVFKHAPAGGEGRTSGSLQMGDVLGTALSAGLAGALVATLGTAAGLALAFTLTAAVSLLGLLVAGRLAD